MQEEEEDSEEEIKRLEDSLEALAILKDYTSPWPLDSDGMPIAAAGGGGGRSTAAPPSALSTFGSTAAAAAAAASDSEVPCRLDCVHSWYLVSCDVCIDRLRFRFRFARSN